MHKIHFQPGLRRGPCWVRLRCLYVLVKVPVWFNLVLLIYPLYGPWKSLKSPWIWFWQTGKNPEVQCYEIWHWCSTAAPNVIINFSEIKVRVQGQNLRIKNLLLVIARTFFKISYQILQSREVIVAGNMTSDQEMAAWCRLTLCDCFFSLSSCVLLNRVLHRHWQLSDDPCVAVTLTYLYIIESCEHFVFCPVIIQHLCH